MAYHYSTTVRAPFSEVIDHVTRALQQNGFTIITSIDLKEAMKGQISHDFRNYQILSACDPELAYRAITLESHIGLALPCNVIVQEHENGTVEVSALNLMEALERNAPVVLINLADELSKKLRTALDKANHDAMHTEIDEVLNVV